MKIIDKQKNYAFGKDIFLLGVNECGEKVWLEEASWGWDWYWGFGYLETYINNGNPKRARDVSSHTHYDSMFFTEKQNGEYIYHIYDLDWQATTLTQDEAWTLSELMKTFYILRQTADLFHSGGANITNNPCIDILKNESETKRINEVLLPEVFKQVYKLLTP